MVRSGTVSLCLFLVLGLLCACAPGGGGRKGLECSAEEEVCIDAKIDDTFNVADPVKLKIKVTSRIDVSELFVHILASGISIDGPETWEKSSTPGYVGEGNSGWFSDIKAGQTLTFTRILHFPADREGWFSVSCLFQHKDLPLEGSNYIKILILEDKGMAIGTGTPVPAYTPKDRSDVYNWSEMTPTPSPSATLSPEAEKRPSLPTATPPVAYPEPKSLDASAPTPYP